MAIKWPLSLSKLSEEYSRSIQKKSRSGHSASQMVGSVRLLPVPRQIWPCCSLSVNVRAFFIYHPRSISALPKGLHFQPPGDLGEFVEMLAVEWDAMIAPLPVSLRFQFARQVDSIEAVQRRCTMARGNHLIHFVEKLFEGDKVFDRDGGKGICSESIDGSKRGRRLGTCPPLSAPASNPAARAKP